MTSFTESERDGVLRDLCPLEVELVTSKCFTDSGPVSGDPRALSPHASPSTATVGTERSCHFKLIPRKKNGMKRLLFSQWMTFLLGRC